MLSGVPVYGPSGTSGGFDLYPENIICPFCSCPVNIIPFGFGWIGICCNEIAYSSKRPPTNINVGVKPSIHGKLKRQTLEIKRFLCQAARCHH